MKTDMSAVNIHEAKTHLSRLVEQAAKGESFVIAKAGKPIARLIGAADIDRARVEEAVEELRRLRKSTSLGGLSWKALRDEGRR